MHPTPCHHNIQYLELYLMFSARIFKNKLIYYYFKYSTKCEMGSNVFIPRFVE